MVYKTTQNTTPTRTLKVLLSCIFLITLSACQDLQPTHPITNESKDRSEVPSPILTGTLSIQIQGLGAGHTVMATIKNQKGDVVSVEKVSQENSPLEKELPVGDYTVTTESVDTGYRSLHHKQRFSIQSHSISGTIAEFEKITDDSFHFHWEGDPDGFDYEYSSETVENTVNFKGEQINYSKASSAAPLLQEYKIILSNDGDIPWTGSSAAGLLKTVKSLPHEVTSSKMKFIISSQELPDDISIDGSTVTLSSDAFNYAEPKMVKFNGRLGHFFSRRLFHALIHLYTDYGRDEDAVRKVLNDKFALTTNVSKSKIQEMTGEHWDHYQSFKPRELVKIIIAMAETPEGYYKVPGLRFLLRRRDGQPHPVLKEAIAVASPAGPNVNRYIEFMETAFINGRTHDDIQKTVLHEKSHFLWTNVFSDEIKEKWIEIGGWYRNPNDPSGWTTTSTTHFVTAYAHLLDPNEDMAESLAYYIRHPNKLRSVAQMKYDFIEKYIMNGYKYMTQIRSDLQFQVLNLFPDYDYPGKIKRVDVYAEGNGLENKNVTIEIELSQIEGYKTSAKLAFLRILSSIDTHKDLYLYPVNGNKHILRGQTTFPKNAKNGYWITQQISVEDDVGNRRYEDLDDFGFKLLINNEVEDKEAPHYVRGSMQLTSQIVQKEGHDVYEVTAEWQINENVAMNKRGAYASLAFQGADRVYSLRKWGRVNTQNNRGSVTFYVNEYFPEGNYGISYVKMSDRALNNGDEYFSQSPKDEGITTIWLNPSNRDSLPPELDLNNISISATPVNPESPNGETLVDISIRVKDDKSGTGHISFRLEDPVGKTHHFYFYHKNFNTLFFKGNPTEWRELNITVTLPEGSAPGTWGLRELYIEDKGGNFKTHNFTEIIHFVEIEAENESSSTSTQ